MLCCDRRIHGPSSPGFQTCETYRKADLSTQPHPKGGDDEGPARYPQLAATSRTVTSTFKIPMGPTQNPIAGPKPRAGKTGCLSSEALEILAQAWAQNSDGEYTVSDDKMQAAKRELLPFWGFPRDIVRPENISLVICSFLVPSASNWNEDWGVSAFLRSILDWDFFRGFQHFSHNLGMTAFFQRSARPERFAVLWAGMRFDAISGKSPARFLCFLFPFFYASNGMPEFSSGCILFGT